MTAVAARPRRGGDAPQAPAPARDGARRRRRSESAAGWLFIGPATLIIVGLGLFPAAWAALLALQSWNGFSPARFVGAANFTEMASDPDLGSAVDVVLCRANLPATSVRCCSWCTFVVHICLSKILQQFASTLTFWPNGAIANEIYVDSNAPHIGVIYYMKDSPNTQ